MVDIEVLSDDELEVLKGRIEAEIRKRAARTKAAVRKQIAELAEKHAIDLTTIASRGGRKGGEATTPEPRYRDPGNEFNTWAGKGRKPKWLTDRLAAGEKLEDFAIAS